MNEMCRSCNVVDDENHRLNDCPVHKSVNFFDTQLKVDFTDVFSTDINILKRVIKQIGKVWNVQNAHGTMNK